MILVILAGFVGLCVIIAWTSGMLTRETPWTPEQRATHALIVQIQEKNFWITDEQCVEGGPIILVGDVRVAMSDEGLGFNGPDGDRIFVTGEDFRKFRAATGFDNMQFREWEQKVRTPVRVPDPVALHTEDTGRATDR